MGSCSTTLGSSSDVVEAEEVASPRQVEAKEVAPPAEAGVPGGSEGRRERGSEGRRDGETEGRERREGREGRRDPRRRHARDR